MGIVFYQILNQGRLLWYERTKKEVYEALRRFNLEEIEVPERFDKTLLQKMLSKDPYFRLSPFELSIEKLVKKNKRKVSLVSFENNVYSQNLSEQEFEVFKACIKDIFEKKNLICSSSRNDAFALRISDLHTEYFCEKVKKVCQPRVKLGFNRSLSSNILNKNSK